MTHYAVVTINNGRMLYAGTCLHTAASWLAPGSCYGKGASSEDADSIARAWREVFRERQGHIIQGNT